MRGVGRWSHLIRWIEREWFHIGDEERERVGMGQEKEQGVGCGVSLIFGMQWLKSDGTQINRACIRTGSTRQLTRGRKQHGTYSPVHPHLYYWTCEDLWTTPGLMFCISGNMMQNLIMYFNNILYIMWGIKKIVLHNTYFIIMVLWCHLMAEIVTLFTFSGILIHKIKDKVKEILHIVSDFFLSVAPKSFSQNDSCFCSKVPKLTYNIIQSSQLQ